MEDQCLHAIGEVGEPGRDLVVSAVGEAGNRLGSLPLRKGVALFEWSDVVAAVGFCCLYDACQRVRPAVTLCFMRDCVPRVGSLA